MDPDSKKDQDGADPPPPSLQEFDLPPWIGFDLAPLGPKFLWALRVLSCSPRGQDSPWEVVQHGICKTERAARITAGLEAGSVTYRVRNTLERLCWSGNDQSFPRSFSDSSGSVPVGWWRGTEDQARPAVGLVRVGSVDIFSGPNLDAWGLAREASTALFGKPLDIFEDP